MAGDTSFGKTEISPELEAVFASHKKLHPGEKAGEQAASRSEAPSKAPTPEATKKDFYTDLRGTQRGAIDSAHTSLVERGISMSKSEIAEIALQVIPNFGTMLRISIDSTLINRIVDECRVHDIPFYRELSKAQRDVITSVMNALNKQGISMSKSEIAEIALQDIPDFRTKTLIEVNMARAELIASIVGICTRHEAVKRRAAEIQARAFKPSLSARD